MAMEDREAVEGEVRIHSKSSGDKIGTDGLFSQLKDLVSHIEHELQVRQEELEVQSEELEVQNQELRESYDALQKSEAISSRLALIVESSDAAIISKSLDGVIASWNTGAEKIFGYTANEIIGKNISILVPPGHYDELPDILHRIKYGEHIEHYETVRMRKDGTLVEVSVTVSPVKDKAGTVVGASSIKRDISKEKHLEKALQVRQEELEVQAEELEVQNQELRENNDALQRSEAINSFFTAIIESSDDAIISKSLDGSIMSWNASAERMFGYTADEVIGKNVSLLVPPGHDDEIPGILGRIKNGLCVEHLETVRMSKEGKLIDVSITISPIKNKSGMIIGASSIKRDITERKRSEEALQQKQEELEVQAEELEVQNEEIITNNNEIQDAKMQAELFLDLMGHDISNMHQIAMGQLELAQVIMGENGRLEQDNKELIDTSVSVLKRSAQLVENVRKLQKIRAGDFKLESIDVCRLIADVVEENSLGYGKINVISHPGNTYFVRANPLLKDVFTNIIGNAIKHSKGKASISVDVNKIDKNGHTLCLISIEDDGPGIPDELKEKIFHRFNRGQTDVKGTGLGLYLVKTMINNFGGQVKVENRIPGDYKLGSRFQVYLPVAEDKNVE
jgi:PAS domain S-box-containing protein